MNSRLQHILRVSVPRFVVSVLFGAAFYVAWMALFLVCSGYCSPLFRGLLWILAPVITGLGFFAGAALYIRLRRLTHPPFLHIYLYPLTGCSIGAAVVFPFGPMLIVFGMCLLGSLSILLFEFVDFRRFASTTQADLQDSQTQDG
ncbi:MAG: hypothetical protein OEW48_16130 [Phycisphaerae bacterium]|nr:hypothetical protein [Phycisphaerae bacterium]